MYTYIYTIARSHISCDSSMCCSVSQCGTVRIHIILVHTITRSRELFDSSVCCSVLQCVAECKHTILAHTITRSHASFDSSVCNYEESYDLCHGLLEKHLAITIALIHAIDMAIHA